MTAVTKALSIAWELPVLCNCDDTCFGDCMQNSINVVGVNITLNGMGKSPLVSLHPSTLDDSWSLKWVAPLQSEDHCGHRYIFDLFIGVMQGNLTLIQSWAGLLLSAAAWLQVAILSGFQKSKLIGPLCEAVTRACAHSTDDAEPSSRWVGYIIRFLPTKKGEVCSRLYHWLRGNGFWAGYKVTSWHTPHKEMGHSEFCGTWHNDSEGLLAMT